MIDYKLLAKSIDYYESFGFRRVESPWTVTEAVVDITKPLAAFVIWPIVCIHGTLYDLKREDTHFALLFFKNFVSSIAVFLGFTFGGFCVLFLGSIACGMVWGMWNYAMTSFQ